MLQTLSKMTRKWFSNKRTSKNRANWTNSTQVRTLSNSNLDHRVQIFEWTYEDFDVQMMKFEEIDAKEWWICDLVEDWRSFESLSEGVWESVWEIKSERVICDILNHAGAWNTTCGRIFPKFCYCLLQVIKCGRMTGSCERMDPVFPHYVLQTPLFHS